MIVENIKIMYKAWFDAEMRDKWISETEPYERWLERKLFEAQSKSKESDSLPCVSKCSAKKCNEPAYEFGMCHKHYCISEMNIQSGC